LNENELLILKCIFQGLVGHISKRLLCFNPERGSSLEIRGLPLLRCTFLNWAMGRSKSRFRISICDKESGESLKVELIDAAGLWSERRYKIRLNGKAATQLPEGTLTEVFDRLRRWMVKRA
jgi:hypothetical protein